jgi:hypothetical protein
MAKQKDYRVKYTKVNFNPARIERLFKAGKSVNQIALAIGYPPRTGQNRVRAVLLEAGLYSAKKATKTTAKTKATKPASHRTKAVITASALERVGKVLTIPAPRDAQDRMAFHTSLREAFKVTKSRFDKLQPKQRNAWMESLVGMLMAEAGLAAPRAFEPIMVPAQYAKVAQA